MYTRSLLLPFGASGPQAERLRGPLPARNGRDGRDAWKEARRRLLRTSSLFFQKRKGNVIVGSGVLHTHLPPPMMDAARGGRRETGPDISHFEGAEPDTSHFAVGQVSDCIRRQTLSESVWRREPGTGYYTSQSPLCQPEVRPQVELGCKSTDDGCVMYTDRIQVFEQNIGLPDRIFLSAIEGELAKIG